MPNRFLLDRQAAKQYKVPSLQLDGPSDMNPTAFFMHGEKTFHARLLATRLYEKSETWVAKYILVRRQIWPALWAQMQHNNNIIIEIYENVHIVIS